MNRYVDVTRIGLPRGWVRHEQKGEPERLLVSTKTKPLAAGFFLLELAVDPAAVRPARKPAEAAAAKVTS